VRCELSMVSRKNSVSASSLPVGERFWCARIELHSSTHCPQIYAGWARLKVGLSIKRPAHSGPLLQKEQRGSGFFVAAPAIDLCSKGFGLEISPPRPQVPTIYDSARNLTQVLPAQLRKVGATRQPECQIDVGDQIGEHVPHTFFAVDRKAVCVRPPQ